MKRALAFLLLGLIAIVCGDWTFGVATTPAVELIVPGGSQSNPTNSQTKWRDQEVTTGWFTRGQINLRGCFNAGIGNGYCHNDQLNSSSGLFFSVGVGAPGVVKVGICNGQNAFGNVCYNTLVESTPSSCITNWPSSGNHTFTFGVQGFQVYLKIDGVIAQDTCQTNPALGNIFGNIQYFEYRPGCCDALSPSIWIQGGGNGQAMFKYFPYTFLYSSISGSGTGGVGSGTMTFDPRDFGMRNMGTCTGCSSAPTGSVGTGSSTITLNGVADIRVGDHIVVEVGTEAGYPTFSALHNPTFPNVVGVGGTAPVLNYATTATMNADTSQPNGQQAWIHTDGHVWEWTTPSGGWTELNSSPTCHYTSGSDCYFTWKVPVSLAGWVTAVDTSPAHLITINTSASTTATNANVRLDVNRSFLPMSNSPSNWFIANFEDGLEEVDNMTITIPAGDWWEAGVISTVDGFRNNLTVYGAGPFLTTMHAIHGWTPGIFNLGGINVGQVVHDIGFEGAVGDLTAAWLWKGTNRNIGEDSVNHNTTFAANDFTPNNLTLKNIYCLNMGNCANGGGNQTIMRDSTLTMSQPIREYNEWEFQINDCNPATTNQMINLTVTGPFLIKAYAMFACHGGQMIHSAGQNALYDLNSSTNWLVDFNTEFGVFDGTTDTFTTGSFINENNGGPNEGIMQLNAHAFGTGNTGKVNNARIIQQGYTDSASYNPGTDGGTSIGFNNSIPFVVNEAPETNLTFQGQYPGASCSTNLGGYFQAPNWDSNSGLSGPTIILGNGSTTNTIAGMRIVGTARTGANSAHLWGNIFQDVIGSLDPSTTVTNTVADIIRSGGTQSGNQNNLTYCNIANVSLLQSQIVLTTSGNGVTSSTATLTGTTAGDLIIVGISWCTSGSGCTSAGTGTTVSSVTSGAGDTCLQVPNAFVNNGSKIESDIWYCKNIVGATDTIKAIMSSTSDLVTMALSEWKGANTSTPLDPGTGNNSQGTGGGGGFGSTIATPTSVANEIVYAISNQSGVVQFPGVQGVNPVVGVGSAYYDAYSIALTTGSYGIGWFYSGGGPSVTSIAAFKP